MASCDPTADPAELYLSSVYPLLADTSDPSFTTSPHPPPLAPPLTFSSTAPRLGPLDHSPSTPSHLPVVPLQTGRSTSHHPRPPFPSHSRYHPPFFSSHLLNSARAGAGAGNRTENCDPKWVLKQRLGLGQKSTAFSALLEPPKVPLGDGPQVQGLYTFPI